MNSTNDRFCLRGFLAEKEVWFLLAAGLLFFYRPLFTGETFYYRDLYLHFYPQKLRWLQIIKSGELPLWDPFLHGGQPFLADINNMALYPSNLLYLILPLPFVFNLEIVLHILASACLGYLLARSLELHPKAGIVVGTIVAFCGFRLSQVNLMNHCFASTYTPALLLFWNSYLRSGERKWFFRSAIAGMLQIFAGAPEMAVLTMLLLLGWSIFSPHAHIPLFQRIRSWIYVQFVILCLAMVQLLPSAEMLLQSTRAEGEGFYSFTAWSLHMARFPEMIFPGFFGPIDKIFTKDYWGTRFEDLGNPYILSIYFGCLPLLFAAAALKLNSALPKRSRLFLLLFAICSITLSLGKYLPFAETVYNHSGFLKLVRYPVKFMSGAVLPVSLLAGTTVHHLYTGKGRISRVFVGIFWFTSVLLLLWFAAFKTLEPLQGWFQQYFHTATAEWKNGLSQSFLHAAVVCTVATLLFQLIQISGRRAYLNGLVILILADLLWAARPINPVAPAEFFREIPGVAYTIHNKMGDGKLFRARNPNDIVYYIHSNDIVVTSRWVLETLDRYAGPLYSIPIVYHDDFDNLAQKEIVRLGDKIHPLPWVRRLPALSAAGVKLILTSDLIDLTDLKLVATVYNRSNKPFYLYENFKMIGSAKRVRDVLHFDSFENGLDRITQPEFDPSRTVLLPGEQRSVSCNEKDGKVQLAESSYLEMKYSTEGECGGYLVFSLPFYKGWHVTIDSKKVELLRANLAFSAIPLEAGHHSVVLNYLPYSVVTGFFISAGCFFILVFFRFRYNRTSSSANGKEDHVNQSR